MEQCLSTIEVDEAVALIEGASHELQEPETAWGGTSLF